MDYSILSTIVSYTDSPLLFPSPNLTAHPSGVLALPPPLLSPPLVSPSLVGSLEHGIELTNQETHPASLSYAVRNLMYKHGQEIRDTIDSFPTNRLASSYHGLRAAFRAFYAKQEVSVLEFFDRPIGSNPTLRQSVQILRRFARPDFNANRVKIRDLCLDCDTTSYVSNLCQKMDVEYNPETNEVQNWIHQTKTLFDEWKHAVLETMDTEKVLEGRLQTFQDIYKKAETILALPICDGYEDLAQSMEVYLKRIFHEQNLEGVYGAYITALKKLCVLTDTISPIRSLLNSFNEPICSVCLNEPISMTIIPCGHTFCKGCGIKQITTCYVCRVNVKDRLRIYFS